jgi:diguanylate cyclase (GGDEF)-like protein
MTSKHFAAMGFVWGIPVPIATVSVHLLAAGEPLTFGAAAALVAAHPMHLLFMLHPVLFAVAFALFGTALMQRSAQIDALVGKLEKLATSDELTGLGNKRAFDRYIEAEVARADRESGDMSVVFLDLDFFKSVNDNYGHQAGDAVLAAFGDRLTRILRPYDRAFRYGGEEFVVVAPGADAATGHRIAERIRRFVADVPFNIEGAGALNVTLSAGVATLRDGETSADVVERADQRVYRAKKAGRNRVVSSADVAREPTGVVQPISLRTTDRYASLR